jgi:hypothetical protein
MRRVTIAVTDINGAWISTTDTEIMAREWLWRTLTWLHDNWPSKVPFRVVINQMEFDDV